MVYSVERRDKICVKEYGFCLLFKTGEISIVKNCLMVVKNLQQMQYKLLQREKFKKQQKQLLIYLVVKLLTK